MSAMMTEVRMAAPRPAQAEPVNAATAAAAKAPASILPSRPISTIPERSESNPAMAQKISGVERRKVAPRVSSRELRSISRLLRLGGAPLQQREEVFEPRPGEMHQGTGEEDDEALDHHRHAAGDGRNLE